MAGLIERDLLTKILRNIKRREIIAVRGPRQSGKSTLLEMLKKGLLETGIDENRIVLLTFEDPAILDEFTKDPRRYLSTFMKGSERYYFLLDEVQYDKEAGKRLKLIYDTMPNVKLIVTGSSTLNVNKIATLLVGRAFLYELLPLSFGEYLRYVDSRLYNIFEHNHQKLTNLILKGTHANFDNVSLGEIEGYAEEYIRFGGYPAVATSRYATMKAEVLRNIYITYLEKDIPGVFGITDTQILRKTILNLALNIGDLLDYNGIASDVGLYYSKLVQYIGILEDTYIIRSVSPFYRNRLTELKKNKKIYFFDTGMRNYIAGNFDALDKRGDSGRLLENFAASELFSISSPTQNVNYWRTTAKAEVDFVFSFSDSVVPIEIKHKNIKKPVVERSMQSFIKLYRPKSAIILGKGTISSVEKGQTRVYFPSSSYL